MDARRATAGAPPDAAVERRPRRSASRLRLIVAIGVAIVLCTFMMYTALLGRDVAEPVIEAEQLAAQRHLAEREQVQLVGVARGPVRGAAERTMRFTITDRTGHHGIRVVYSGSVPDAFRPGRNVVVKGRIRSGVFHAVPGSLVTKCPSKFEARRA